MTAKLGRCLGLGVGFLISLIYAKFMFDLHENTLWFSNLREVEREISFRTESGLYYSFYKQFVSADSLSSAFYALIHDNSTEYPVEINVLQRFNIIPEVSLALLYRSMSTYISVTPMFFYVYSSFFFAGLSVFFVCLLAYVIIGGWPEALLVSVWMLVNYEDSSRVNFAVNLREIYALPFLWIQFLYIFLAVIQRRAYNKHVVLFTFLFSICWQFNQFVLMLQSLCIFLLGLFFSELRPLLQHIIVSQSIGYLFTGIVQFFQPMLLLSPLFQMNLVILVLVRFAPPHFKLVKSLSVFIMALVVIIISNYAVKTVLSEKSDTHIWFFVAAKLGVWLKYIPFETALYICHRAFSFLDYDFIERTYKNGSLQLFVIGLVYSVLCIIKHWWRGSKLTPELLLLTLKCLFFGCLAFTTMRMKYIFLPLMLILASTAFCIPQKLLGRFVTLTLMLALTIGISNSHYKFYQKVMSHEQEFYDPDTVKLMEWIDEQPEAMVFSGSMQLLASVKCCTGRAITNHPHFEDREIRERTFQIYQIYGRRSVEEVYQILKREKTTHIILEDTICLAKSNGCALKDLVDTANGHRTESGRYPMKLGLCWAILTTFCVNASVRRVVANEHQLVVQVPGYSPKENDAYIGVSIKATPGYIVRFEPFAHADRIHHMLLYGCDKPAYDSGFWEGGATCAGSSHILYAWARNAPSLSLPESVGFAIGNKGDPVQYIVLQVHYAHPFSGNVRDFAGITMHLVDTRPANLAAVYLFVSGEAIPPKRDIALNNISCTYEGDAELTPFAFRTHTHQMGRIVSAYFRRKEEWTQIGKRNPQWPQLFQKIERKIVIKKGDFMAATCRFDSHDKVEYTPMGSMGTAEMCNFYMMFYRSADSQDPFPWGGGCGGNENEDLVSKEYPKDGISLLPSHPEWEHVAHQMDKPFGVKQRLGVSKIGEQKLGQISGLAYGKDESLYVFHRSTRIWDGSTFDQQNKLQDETPINAEVLLHVDVGLASVKLRGNYGKDEFYLPHGIFVDDSDYIYTTDVGSHQVIKWKVEVGKLKQVFALGERFQPGSDTKHFCKPSGIAVSRNDGTIYVSDGYCNNRVMVFDKTGKFIQQFGTASTLGREGARPQLGTFFLPHDIVLDNKQRRIFVSDRENGRVQVFNHNGDPVQEVSYPSLFRDVYSADYDEDYGLILIPGTSVAQNAQIEAFVCPAPSFKLQFSFRPTDSSFKRPHIIRIRNELVAIGEIAEEGGQLSLFDIVAQGHRTHVSSKELYASPDDSEDGSPFFIILLVLASVLIACFVAYMRYRDVSDGNIIDRTVQHRRQGFKPLSTDDILSDNSDDEEEYSHNKP